MPLRKSHENVRYVIVLNTNGYAAWRRRIRFQRRRLLKKIIVVSYVKDSKLILHSRETKGVAVGTFNCFSFFRVKL